MHRRGYSIDGMVGSEGRDPAFSKMSVAASGNERILAQVPKQRNRLEVPRVRGEEVT